MIAFSLVVFIALSQCTKNAKFEQDVKGSAPDQHSKIKEPKKNLIEEGKQIFRFDAFGDEDFWSGLLHIDKAIAGFENGGFGTGVSPNKALAVGLKVDAEALPPNVVSGIKTGDIDLDDPATTLEL